MYRQVISVLADVRSDISSDSTRDLEMSSQEFLQERDLLTADHLPELRLQDMVSATIQRKH